MQPGNGLHSEPKLLNFDAQSRCWFPSPGTVLFMLKHDLVPPGLPVCARGHFAPAIFWRGQD